MAKKILLLILGLIIIFVCSQYFYGGSPTMISNSAKQFEILAHRGVNVNWKKGTYNPRTGCEATHIYKPTFGYLENTIESIEAAFNLGATIVEIDIRRTKDNQLVLFHDYKLDCRTNGNGKLVDHELEYLKTLDIGYGYTYDDGKTYPFKGKGIGKMPTFKEVLYNFPDKKFLVDDKDGSLKTVEILAGIIKNLPLKQQESLYYWGRPKTFKYVQKEIPSVKRLLINRSEGREWFKKYFLTLGLAGFPEESKGLVFALRPEHTKYMWGWPYRFIAKVHKADAKLFLYLDTEDEVKKYVDFPVDGIVTDYIEIVGKHFKDK